MCGAVLRIAFFLRGIAGAHGGADPQSWQTLPLKLFGDAGEWVLQVDLDVVGQRLEGRDIDHESLFRQMTAHFQALMNQVVDHRQKRSKGFTGAGGRGDQGGLASLDQRPRVGLGSGDCRKCLVEPGADGRMKVVEHWSEGLGKVHACVYEGER